jgi:hypothetical protein
VVEGMTKYKGNTKRRGFDGPVMCMRLLESRQDILDVLAVKENFYSLFESLFSIYDYERLWSSYNAKNQLDSLKEYQDSTPGDMFPVKGLIAAYIKWSNRVPVKDTQVIITGALTLVPLEEVPLYLLRKGDGKKVDMLTQAIFRWRMEHGV